MKFMLGIATYGLMALILVAGILAVMKGSFWLLAAGVAAYLVLLIKYGCHAH